MKFKSGYIVSLGISVLFLLSFINSIISFGQSLVYLSGNQAGTVVVIKENKNTKYLLSDINLTFENENQEDEKDNREKKNTNEFHFFDADVSKRSYAGLSEVKGNRFRDCLKSKEGIIPRYVLFHCWKFHLS